MRALAGVAKLRLRRPRYLSFQAEKASCSAAITSKSRLREYTRRECSCKWSPCVHVSPTSVGVVQVVTMRARVTEKCGRCAARRSPRGRASTPAGKGPASLDARMCGWQVWELCASVMSGRPPW
eukprot:362912-Chlamydomonas_euryale.AAC.1